MPEEILFLLILILYMVDVLVYMYFRQLNCNDHKFLMPNAK